MKIVKKNSQKNFALILNIIWSVIAVLVNYLITFFTTSYITSTAGAEAYGFVTLANTFTSYIDIITIALNAFAGRYISIAYHKGDYEEANKYFNSTIIADAILSLVIMLLGCMMILKLDILLNVSNNLTLDVKILFFLVLIRYLVSLIGTAFNVSTFITNRISLSEKQKSISYIIQGVIVLALFTLFPIHIWYVGVASAISIIYVNIMNIRYTHLLTKELTLNIKYFDIQVIKKLVSSGIWNSINNLGNVLNSGLDLLVSNLMLTSQIMGEISIGKTLGTMINALLESFVNSFRPKILKYYAEEKNELLIEELKRAMKVTGTISNIVFAVFLTCGYTFMQLWILKGNINFIFNIAVIVLMSDIMIGVVKPLYYVFTLTNKLKLPCLITIVSGFLNVVFMYLLIKYTDLGAYAVVFTTLVLNFVHFFDTPIYSAYCLKEKLSVFYPTIIRHFISCFLMVISMTFVISFIPDYRTWMCLIIRCIICGSVGVIVSIITVCSKEELKQVLGFVKRLKNKLL